MESNKSSVTNLRVYLVVQRVNQARLAQKIGVDPALLCRMVNGFREPSPKVRHNLSLELGVDKSWLFEPFEWGKPPVPLETAAA